MRLQQPVRPVLLHVLAAMANWHHADVHVAHARDNCTMIGHGADAAMTWNLDTSKYCYYNTHTHTRGGECEWISTGTMLKVEDHSSAHIPCALPFISLSYIPPLAYFYCHKYVCN